MQVACENIHPAPDHVRPSCLRPTLPPMLDNCIIIDLKGPTGSPIREVFLEREARNPGKLRGMIRKPILKASVMISKGPHKERLRCRFLNLSQTSLYRFKLFAKLWRMLPSNPSVPADPSAIKKV